MAQLIKTTLVIDLEVNGMDIIKERVITILREINAEIQEDTSIDLLVAGIIDSFDMVNIIGSFESVFNITIEPEDIIPANFNSVDNMAKLLNDKYMVERNNKCMR